MGLEYKYYYRPDIDDEYFGEISDCIECNSCQCGVPTYPFRWEPPFLEKHELNHNYLCAVCSGTFISHKTRSRYESSEVVKIMAQIANHLKECFGLFKDVPHEKIPEDEIINEENN